MNLRFLRRASLIGALLVCGGCKVKRNEPPPTPSPTPKPTPAGIYVPAKKLDTARLFNGMKINTSVETVKGEFAADEKDDPASYTLNLQVKVRVPKPHTNLKQLQKLNGELPKVLFPWLEAALPKAKIAPFFDDFYRLKVNSLTHDLPRLDQLLSRQHFFDCETALLFEAQPSKRRVILVQAPMETDTDGSDADRVPVVDSNSSTFQPITSYKWPKKTDKPNPFLPASEERLRKLQQELAARQGNPDRMQDLSNTLIPDARGEVALLKKSSFLVAAADPYVVLPHLMMSSDYEPYSPKVGDYCVVIYEATLYPAIVGDVGPNYKMGEASLRICKEINSIANANNGATGDLKITYLVFPNSADKPFDSPDLDKWRAKCDQLLTEMGGYKGELKTWEDLTKPKPTPTPSPSPSPSASPAPSASPMISSSPSPSPAASPSAAPSPSPTAKE